MKKIVTVVALTSFLAACATGSKDIDAGYTSPPAVQRLLMRTTDR